MKRIYTGERFDKYFSDFKEKYGFDKKSRSICIDGDIDIVIDNLLK